MKKPLFYLLTALLVTVVHAQAELPKSSAELLEKLKEYEAEESAKLEKKLNEKRLAVVEVLRQQLTAETRNGNLDGAIAIQSEIAAITGEEKITRKMLAAESEKTSPADTKRPKDAVRLKGNYYKVYAADAPLTWQEARAKCQALGGDLGWVDDEESVRFLVQIMKPVVDEKGHAPIWVGAQRDANGDWVWLSGEKVANEFWQEESHKKALGDGDVMIRWIASFRASGPVNDRVIGYLCRWE